MPAGFFHESSLATKAPARTVAACGLCGLYRSCKSPKMPVTGKGRRGILVVAEAPGADEDERGTQLIGKAGQHLRRALDGVGIDLDRDCWKTNAIICRPPNNRTPTPLEIEYCRPNLNDAIRELRPAVIIPLGAVAVRSLLEPYWRSDMGELESWVGWRIPLGAINSWVCPTWHPSYVMRKQAEDPAVASPLSLWWGRHLAAAAAIEGRPYGDDGPPDYAAQVQVIVSPAEAAKRIDWIVRQGGTCSWDIETTALKSDGPDAHIVSASICWLGKRTISFPWHGPVVDTMRRFVRSPSPKIGYNCKFEQRFILRVFGHGVRGWCWDGFQAAHVCDNRPGINSLKFQALVRLGVPQYDSHIKKHLRSKGSREANQILQEIELTDLLKYGGMDSALEYAVAMHQMAELGITPPE